MRTSRTIGILLWAMSAVLASAGLTAAAGAPEAIFAAPREAIFAAPPAATFAAPPGAISFAPPAIFSAPPPAPSALTATAVSASRIDLAWVDNAGTERFFKLQRRANGGAWVGIFLPRNTTSYADTGLAPGEYCYRIRSHTASEWSSYAISTPACVTLAGSPPPPPPSDGPAPPSNLAATKISESRIDLTWVDNAADETFFKLQRRTDGGSWTGIFLPQNTTSYADTGLAPGQHCYRLRSHTNSDWSAYVLSVPNCITLAGGGGGGPSVPAAPSNLSVAGTTGSSVRLAWDDNAVNETWFKLQRRRDGGTWMGIFLPRNTTSYNDTGLAAGEYCYRVRAHNASGHSDYAFATPSCILIGGSGEVSTQLITSGLAAPVFLTAPFNDDRLFILERPGRIRIFKNGALLPTPFLDITDRTAILGEGGLLGLAFAPDYATSGLFYVNYTDNDPDMDGDGDTVISRFRVSGNPDVAVASSEEVLLHIDQPFRNHNGGTVAFGADGFLYIGMGDGGGGNDPGNRAQTDSSILGKMLRIDVSGGLGSGYSFPPGNPHRANPAAFPGWLDETWSKGWRNPYRFSFDRIMGDMYVGDVGQVDFEEISVEAFGDGGRNYGWKIMEGKSCRGDVPGCDMTGLTFPVHDYRQIVGSTGIERCSVTGGYVYRGSIPEIRGHYFFGDFCSGEVLSFVWDGAGGFTQFTDRTTDLAPPSGLGRIAGFGEDGFGELYIIDIGGRVFKIVPGS